MLKPAYLLSLSAHRLLFRAFSAFNSMDRRPGRLVQAVTFRAFGAEGWSFRTAPEAVLSNQQREK